jgi:hypothetical protein
MQIGEQAIYNITAPHEDTPSTGTWVIMVEGIKRFYLLPPAQSKLFKEESNY